jgi:hypothetical protein
MLLMGIFTGGTYKTSNQYFVGFEILIAVFMSFMLWDTTLFCPLQANRRFGAICRLHIQHPKRLLSKNQAALYPRR